MSSHNEWIKDGTVDTAPVTSSTPVVDESTAAPADTGAAEAVAAAASTEASASGATAAEAAAAGAQAAQDFIEGRVGDAPFQVPKNLSIPWKRGSEEGFATLDEIRSEHMMARDYRVKTSELAAQRRQLETEQRVAGARLTAQQQMLAEMAEQQAKAYASPEEQAQYEAFLEQYRSNPFFRKQVDDARTGRVMTAEREAMAEVQNEEAQYAQVEQIVNTIATLSEKYPGVDPERIRTRYAVALQREELPISDEAVESLYREEAQALSRFAAPLQTELETMRSQVAEMQRQLAAQTHNDRTRTAMERAQNPVGAPAGGNPAAPTPAATNLKGRTLSERSREWSSIR